MKKYLLIILLLFPLVSFADGTGEWCHVRDENENCRFNTAEKCYLSARSGGTCRQNQQFVGADGSGAWCVVTATRRQCKYGRKQCFIVAQEVGGGCVENTERSLQRARASGGAGWEVEIEQFGQDPVF